MGVYAWCEVNKCRRERCLNHAMHKGKTSWIANWQPSRLERRMTETFNSSHDDPKQLAVDRLASWKTDRKRGKMGMVKDVDIFYEAIANRYWKEHASIKGRDPERTTYYTVEQSKEWIGKDRKVSPLTPDELIQFQRDMESLQRKLEADGLSGATVNRYFNIVRAIFKKGVKWGLLKTNPLEFVGRVQEDEPPIRFLEEAEIDKLFATIDSLISEYGKPVPEDRKKRLWQFMTILYHTGARPSSIEECSWDNGDVDLTNKIIWFTTYKGGREQKKHRYPVTMDDDVYKIVAERGEETAHKGLVFDMKDIYKLSRLVVTQSKVNENKPETMHFTIYGLKHCLASHLIMNGASEADVADLFGHTDTRMVHKHYKHLTMAYRRKVQEKAAPSIRRAQLKVV